MRTPNLLAAVAMSVTAAYAGGAFAADTGESLFGQNCSACHQLNGKGIPGAFPALAGNAFVQGPPEAVASTVLNGRGGMPTFGPDLSNETIASILTYVRGAWGNQASPITPALVAAVRGGKTPEKPAGSLQAH